jgi:hypothetical protein
MSDPATSPLLPSRPPLRGSPKRHTDLMEALQASYVRAVAAAAGCVIAGKPEIDEGVDIVLTHTADAHQAEHVARLEIQMKSTSDFDGASNDYISASMTRKRWNYFCTSDPTIDKIIVIMFIPRDQQDWTIASHDTLSVRHCAYWVNIAGEPETAQDHITIKAPTSQIFDDVALCDMMERIGQGGKP